MKPTDAEVASIILHFDLSFIYLVTIRIHETLISFFP